MEQKDLEQMAKDAAKGVPGIVRGAAEKALLEFVRKDGVIGKKDGISDLLQVIRLGEGMIEPLSAINEAVDFVLLADAIDDAPYIKDRAKLKAAIHSLAALAEEAQKLTKGK